MINQLQKNEYFSPKYTKIKRQFFWVPFFNNFPFFFNKHNDFCKKDDNNDKIIIFIYFNYKK